MYENRAKLNRMMFLAAFLAVGFSFYQLTPKCFQRELIGVDTSSRIFIHKVRWEPNALRDREVFDQIISHESCDGFNLSGKLESAMELLPRKKTSVRTEGALYLEVRAYCLPHFPKYFGPGKGRTQVLIDFIVCRLGEECQLASFDIENWCRNADKIAAILKDELTVPGNKKDILQN